MTNPFKGKPIQFGRPIIGTGDPMKLVNDLKKELISRQNARPAQDSIDLGSTPPPRIKLSQIEWSKEFIAALAEKQAEFLNKEMFFYLPTDIYQGCFESKDPAIKEAAKEKAKAILKERGLHIGYEVDDESISIILFRGSEKLAFDKMHFEEEKGE